MRQVFHGREDNLEQAGGRTETPNEKREEVEEEETRTNGWRGGATREEYTTWFLLRSRDVPPASHSF